MTRLLSLILVVSLGLCKESKDLFKDKDCAIVLSSAGAVVTGRDLCIRYSDVEEAFGLARSKVGLRYPARVLTDLSIAQLGTALQETTRILAKRFWLSRWEVENVLPRLETRKTEVGRYCAWPLRRPQAPCPRSRYRRHDGTCNNLLDPARGAASLPFKRLLPPLYADRISEPRVGRDGSPLPLPRLVSTRVHGDVFKRHDLRVSFMFPAWGQLVDHDLTLTAETKEPETRREFDCCATGVSLHPNCYPLDVPRDDPFFKDKRQTCMNMARSLAGVRPGCALGSRVQINLLTSYIDANFIYGSSDKLSSSLRTFQKGLLKTFDAFPELGLKPILPPKTKQPDDGCIRPHPDIYCFLAGDNRVNEQLALGVLHTLAVREHNRIATNLMYINPHWDDEKLYQEARHIMAAIIQHITYNEFLPQLLGEEYLEKYDLKLNPQGYIYSYDPEVDATIPASFGTAAFRFGHSLLPDVMQRRSPTHKLTGERRLSEMLQQPFDLYKPGWVDAYTLGMVNQVSQPMDQSITAEVTNHLFQEPARDFGRDLAAINLGRAREHGVPGYMAYRKHCGLDDMHSWQDMWSFLPNATVSEYLKIYDHPDDVDLWSAGVSELPAPGSMLGPVFSCIIATTFRDLRKGDRFWYENRGFASSFTLDQLREIKKYTLSRFLCNTGDNIETIQIKALLLPDYDENPRVSCNSGEIPQLNLKFWKETPLGTEEGEKYPDKPHIVNYTSSSFTSTSESPWSTYKEKERPSTLYGAPFPHTQEKDMYSSEPQVIYESDIKNQEKFPVVGEDDSLAFVMFSESDKYAIKQDYMYNESTSGSGDYPLYNHKEKYPFKGTSGYESSYRPFREPAGHGNAEKEHTDYYSSSSNKNPYSSEVDHYEKPYKGDTQHHNKPYDGETDHYSKPYKEETVHYNKYPYKGETDHYAIKGPVKEHEESDHYDKYPYKGDTGHFDKPHKGETDHYNKQPPKGDTDKFETYPFKGDTDHYEKNPYTEDTDQYDNHSYQGNKEHLVIKGPVKEYEDPYDKKPPGYSQSSYEERPLLVQEYPSSSQEKNPTKEHLEIYTEEKFPSSDKYYSSHQKEDLDKKPDEYYPIGYPSEQLSSEIHYTIKDKLQPPLFDTVTEDNERYPTKDESPHLKPNKETVVPEKGYYITTASYDIEKHSSNKASISSNGEIYLSQEASDSNEKYINSKLQNKGSSVSSKPAGFDQIVTDLFHNINNNKSDLVLELKDTYNVNTNIIQAKNTQKET